MQLDRLDSLLTQSQSQKVQIFFSCRNLPQDSFLKVYLQETNRHKQQVLKTKIVKNDLNPDYPETLVTEYFFQIRQNLIIEVYHQQNTTVFEGSVKTSIGEIFGAKGKGLEKEIQGYKGQNKGIMILKCQKIQKGSSNILEFNLDAFDLPSGGCFCFGDECPFYKIFKIKKGQQYLVYQSERKVGNNPKFQRVKINEKKLCNNDETQKIIIKVYNNNSFTAPSQLGFCQFTLKQLIRQGHNTHILVDGNGGSRGTLVFHNIRRSKKYEFTDYLMAGMQMALVICIDFTASNGNPTHPNSLHYSTHSKKSQYEEALNETCKIVMDYDADKLVPVYGFGAKVNLPNLKSQGKTHHCFPLNGNPVDPNYFQVEGILKGYRECMQYLQFSGPTYFAPLLQQAMQICEQMKKARKQYMILLILTDGAIHDVQQVENLLVKCSRLPLSIIIVGIGNSNEWSLMHELDDDDMKMTDKQGNKTERDLVQFVEFAQHNNNGVELARQVLQELPRQVEEYHMLCGLDPSIYKSNLLSNNHMSKANIQSGHKNIGVSSKHSMHGVNLQINPNNSISYGKNPYDIGNASPRNPY